MNYVSRQEKLTVRHGEVLKRFKILRQDTHTIAVIMNLDEAWVYNALAQVREHERGLSEARAPERE